MRGRIGRGSLLAARSSGRGRFAVAPSSLDSRTARCLVLPNAKWRRWDRQPAGAAPVGPDRRPWQTCVGSRLLHRRTGIAPPHSGRLPDRGAERGRRHALFLDVRHARGDRRRREFRICVSPSGSSRMGRPTGERHPVGAGRIGHDESVQPSADGHRTRPREPPNPCNPARSAVDHRDAASGPSLGGPAGGPGRILQPGHSGRPSLVRRLGGGPRIKPNASRRGIGIPRPNFERIKRPKRLFHSGLSCIRECTLLGTSHGRTPRSRKASA